MTKVRVKSDEPFEKALRRFKKKCNKEGLMQRIKEIKHFEKPSERRRRRLAQEAEVALAILVVAKQRRAVVAALEQEVRVTSDGQP